MEGKERKRADDLPAGAVEQIRELLNRPREGGQQAGHLRRSGWLRSVWGGNFGARAEANREAHSGTTDAAGGTEAEKTASCVKLQRMDGYYLVDVDGNPHRFTLWETAMQFIREHAGELT